jgi:hypothetical protein
LSGINEGDLREEDKEEGVDFEEGSNFSLRISEFLKGRGGGGGNWRNGFWEALTEHYYCWEFWAQRPGNRKDSWS